MKAGVWMSYDPIVTEFPELVRKFGREKVAKSVAVIMVRKGLTTDEVTRYTGLEREYVERLISLNTVLGRGSR